MEDTQMAWPIWRKDPKKETFLGFGYNSDLVFYIAENLNNKEVSCYFGRMPSKAERAKVNKPKLFS